MFCRPFTGAWIETSRRIRCVRQWHVAPSRGRGLKQGWSRTGYQRQYVAPSRGRGLKPNHRANQILAKRRPFTGAWIETIMRVTTSLLSLSRPFTGAWIETEAQQAQLAQQSVAPSRGRGLKLICLTNSPMITRRPFTGAWIETEVLQTAPADSGVAPSRGRGLKLGMRFIVHHLFVSPLHGGVD